MTLSLGQPCGKRFSGAVGLVMLLCANARAADRDWAAPPSADDAEEQVSFSVSTRAGLVKAPFVTTAFPEVSGFGTVVTGVAAVQFSSIGWLYLRLPISFVRLDFPARAQVAETALGNLEFGLERSMEVHPSFHVGLLAAALLPSAEHGPENGLLNNRALALGNALNGGQDSALLTPGVSGLRLRANLEHTHHPFGFRASLEVPLLVRVFDASLPKDAETHAIGLLPALDLRAALWITSWFGASLGGGVITEPRRVQEPAREDDRKRRVQVVVEPALHVRLGSHVALGLDGSVPVGGTLGGDAWSVGLQGRLGL